tara:strand:+ start:3340 stop:3705 length:366 start_codon:yes stop_codon:yes gene_type:complete
MEIYIVLALLLTLFQSWLIPMAIDIKNLHWMMGVRDSSPSASILLKRARRASLNLHESLAPFLALVLASMYLGIDNATYACWWLILRVVHGVTYLIGVPYVRTLAFIGSILCLAAMAMALL